MSDEAKVPVVSISCMRPFDWTFHLSSFLLPKWFKTNSRSVPSFEGFVGRISSSDSQLMTTLHTHGCKEQHSSFHLRGHIFGFHYAQLQKLELDGTLS